MRKREGGPKRATLWNGLPQLAPSLPEPPCHRSSPPRGGGIPLSNYHSTVPDQQTRSPEPGQSPYTDRGGVGYSIDVRHLRLESSSPILFQRAACGQDVPILTTLPHVYKQQSQKRVFFQGPKVESQMVCIRGQMQYAMRAWIDPDSKMPQINRKVRGAAGLGIWRWIGSATKRPPYRGGRAPLSLSIHTQYRHRSGSW